MPSYLGLEDLGHRMCFTYKGWKIVEPRCKYINAVILPLSDFPQQVFLGNLPKSGSRVPHPAFSSGLQREQCDDSFWKRIGYTPSGADVVIRTGLKDVEGFSQLRASPNIFHQPVYPNILKHILTGYQVWFSIHLSNRNCTLPGWNNGCPIQIGWVDPSSSCLQTKQQRSSGILLQVRACCFLE